LFQFLTNFIVFEWFFTIFVLLIFGINLETLINLFINQTKNNMKKIVFLGFLVFLGISTAFAQTIRVSGTITDSQTGDAVPFASVAVKGTTDGVIADMDGKFDLSVASNAVLVVTNIGYVAQEVSVDGRTVVNVLLESDMIGLEEVLVVAYGTARRATYTGAATQVTARQIENRPISNVTTALEGLSTGVQVSASSGQPGDGQDVRIRGFGSINASSAPLYVVDGIPYALGINNLNPADIESITVLKDAAATSLYGNRAANGVIMIQTKRGQADRPRFEVTSSIGFSDRFIPEYDRLGPAQWTELAWEALRNQLHYTSGQSMEDAAQNATNQIIGNGILYNPWGVPDNAVVGIDGMLNPNARLVYSAEDLDWVGAVTRTGIRKEAGLNYSGGTKTSNYFVSLAYLDDQGFLLKTDFERFTGRINFNTTANDWFKTGFNLSGSAVSSQGARVDSNTGFVNPFFFTRSIGPIYPIYAQNMQTGAYFFDDEGNKIYDIGGMADLGLPARPGGASPGRHNLAETLLNEEGFKRNTLAASTFGEITFLEGLTFTVNASVNFNNYLASSFDNPIVGDGAPSGRGERVNSRITAITLNQLLKYNTSIGKNNFDFLVGHENYDWTYNYHRGFSQDQILAGNSELINFTTINASTSYTQQYRTEGFFSQIRYDYDEKYMLSASIRRDGSSRFYRDVRWGNFWSVGGAWRLDREDFIKDIAGINILMLRASYGETGNDGLDSYYPWHALYSIRNNANEAGFLQSTLPALDLTWESNNAYTIALEFGLFNRIRGNIDFFHRISDNLLFAVPLPVSSGILQEDRNIGTMYNQGIEARIAVDLVKARDFEWNVDFNATSFVNKITRMPGGEEDEIISGTKKLMEGRSIYDFWLRQWWGVNPVDGISLYYAEDTQAAANIFIIGTDTLTSAATNAKYEYSGTAVPSVFGSFTNNFKVGSFDLSVLLVYRLGGKIYDGSYGSLMGYGTWGSAMHVDQANRWTTPGQVTDVPRMNPTEVANANAASTRWLVSANYLNVRSVNLSYTLPKRLVDMLSLSRLRVFMAAENLHLFSARKGMNVQQNFFGTTSNVYSSSRSITFGLNVTL
jgi:TonB-linked SusC/RagA family outer membrane protein